MRPHGLRGLHFHRKHLQVVRYGTIDECRFAGDTLEELDREKWQDAREHTLLQLTSTSEMMETDNPDEVYELTVMCFWYGYQQYRLKKVLPTAASIQRLCTKWIQAAGSDDDDDSDKGPVFPETEEMCWGVAHDVSLARNSDPTFTKYIEHLLLCELGPGASYNGVLNLLHVVASIGNVALVDAILDIPGYSIDAQDPDGRTPLLFSCHIGSTELAQHLLDRGANPSIGHDRDGNQCLHRLHYLEREYIPQIVQRCASAGADVNAQNKTDLETPLHAILNYPISSPTMEAAVRALLACGADPNIVDWHGHTPAAYATRYLQATVLELLLDHAGKSRQALLQIKMDSLLELYHEPPLTRMALGGAAYRTSLQKIIALLLDEATCSAFRHVTGTDGTPALSHAFFSGAMDVADVMLQTLPWVRVDEPDALGCPILRWAIRHRRRVVLDRLVALGANFAYVALDGENAFHVAAEYFPEYLAPLLAIVQGSTPQATAEALASASSADGTTPFDRAVLRGHLEAAKMLLGFAAVDIQQCRIQTVDSSSSSSNGHSLSSILGAVLRTPTASIDQVHFILDLGASPDTDDGGSTVFHSLVKIEPSWLDEDPRSFELDSKQEILKLLVDRFPDHLHKVDCVGRSALHLACWAVRSDIVRCLCELKLDPRMKDAEERTPMDVLQQRKEALAMTETKHLLVRKKVLDEISKTEEALRQFS